MESINELIKDYGDPHRSFAQFMLQERLIEANTTIEIFREFCTALGYKAGNEKISDRESKQLLNNFMETMNETLTSLGFRLIIVADEFKRSAEFLALTVESNYSPFMTQVSGFTQDELKLFHMWLKLMFGGEDNDEEDGQGQSTGDIPVNKALSESKSQGATMIAAQKTLNKFQSEQWIIVENGIVRLHPSAVAELEQVLQIEYSLPICQLCKHPVLVSRLLYSCSCETTFHACCIQKQTFPFKCAGEGCRMKIHRDIMDDFQFID